MIELVPDLQQIAKIKDKFEKYPAAVTGAGLDHANDYLNTSAVKNDLYPPSQSGQPFVWSSEKQRRYVFANIKLPSTRSMNLANSGSFIVEKKFSSLYIYYTNTAPYAKWVIGNFTMIIGHKTRGWQAVNTILIDKYRSEIVTKFNEGTNGTWDKL